MYKYLLVKKSEGNCIFGYMDLPLCIDHRLQDEDVIKMLITYVMNPNMIKDVLEDMEENVPYAVLSNGELYDASKYVQIVIDNELY